MEELGGTQVISSGTEDTAAAQIPSIQAAIADQADAIVIAGNDPDALCPSLQQAQDAGIVVVAFDSDVSCADHLFINQAETNNIGTAEVDYMATLLDGKGEVAILSAAATATNQNAWIEAMKTQFEKYPDMKLVDIVYGNDDPADVAHGAPGPALGAPGPRRHHLADHRGHLDGGAVPVDAPGDRRAADRSRPALADGPVRP